MKIDITLLTHSLEKMPAYVKAAEALGFDGIWTAETSADPFLPLILAAEHSQRPNLGTAIAVTFPRSPTTLAHIAWDLQRYSNGRFILGLGAQVKAHNVLRFGVKWEKPIKKMRETIEAIRAVWHCWQTSGKLHYYGEFFKLGLMTPFFNPGPLPEGVPTPPIYVAAVNKLMLRLAGSHCDGVHIHPLHTVNYLEEVALPELGVGWQRSERTRENFTLSAAIFVIPTDDAKYAAWAEQYVRQQISFYMSTPAYRVVTELHGWQENALRLSKAARDGQWDAMPGMVSDAMLEEFVVTGSWADIPGKVKEKYGDMIDRVNYYLPFVPGENKTGWHETVKGFTV